MTQNTTSTSTQPAFVTFAQELIRLLDNEGLTPILDPATLTGLPENAGWFYLTFGDKNAPRIYINKGKNVVTTVESHVDCSAIAGDSWAPLSTNGKILGRLSADVRLVASCAPLLIAASKRPTAQPTRRVVSVPVTQTPQVLPTTSQQFHTWGAAKPVEITPPASLPFPTQDDQEDEIEDATAALRL